MVGGEVSKVIGNIMDITEHKRMEEALRNSEERFRQLTNATFSNKLSSKYLNLTPKEIEIANLIKEGKTTKKIGELSHVSPGTVAFDRQNIRMKLHLTNKK